LFQVPNSKRAEQDCADEHDGGTGCQDVQFQGHTHAVVSQDVDDGESLADKFSPSKRQKLCAASTQNCRKAVIPGLNHLFLPWFRPRDGARGHAALQQIVVCRRRLRGLRPTLAGRLIDCRPFKARLR
jgi:hypothetical protein